MLLKKTYILSIIICISIHSLAQDVHFSNYYACPMNVNPASTGFSNKTMRFFMNHRSQWSTVSKPYSTQSASMDWTIKIPYLKRDFFGVGLMFIEDKAGTSEYGNQQFSMSLSYIRAIGSTNNQYLSFGLMGSHISRTINYSQLTFDNQWTGEIFDPTAYKGEIFTIDQVNLMDISAGIQWHYYINQSDNLKLGFSAFHINSPRHSLLENDEIRLNRKYVFHGSYYRRLSRGRYLIPDVYMAVQGAHIEPIIGARYMIESNSSKKNYTAFYFGLYSRIIDSGILSAGVYKKDWIFGVSYDINYSGLVPASNTHGAYEVYISYNFTKKKKRNSTKRQPCAKFF